MIKRYESYKNSGVEWIGDIPDHWSTVKIKFITDIYTGNSLNSDLKVVFQSENQNHLPYVSTKDINIDYNTLNYDNGLRIPAENSNYKVAPRGSFLLCIEGANAGKKLAYVLEDCCFVNKLACFNFPNKFLFYYAQSHPFKTEFFISISGLIGGVSTSVLKEFLSSMPSEEEQTQIAGYLDQEISLIDSIISQKKQLIEKLKEQRQAIVNETVIRGLNPNVQLKKSGIEWLGEIPEHWEVKKLKYLGTFQNGVSAGADYFGSGFPFISYSDVYKNEVLPKKVNGLANSSIEERERFSVEKGDVFFTRTSETVEEIGMTSICNNTIENAVFAGFLIRFRPFKDVFLSELYNFYLRSFIPRYFFVREMNLVTRASLSQELLKRLPVLIPPKEEQLAIIDLLSKKQQSIDKSIDGILVSIKKLKEYRQSIISEVVTGKIDVRDWKPKTA